MIHHVGDAATATGTVLVLWASEVSPTLSLPLAVIAASIGVRTLSIGIGLGTLPANADSTTGDAITANANPRSFNRHSLAPLPSW